MLNIEKSIARLQYERREAAKFEKLIEDRKNPSKTVAHEDTKPKKEQIFNCVELDNFTNALKLQCDALEPTVIAGVDSLTFDDMPSVEDGGYERPYCPQPWLIRQKQVWDKLTSNAPTQELPPYARYDKMYTTTNTKTFELDAPNTQDLFIQKLVREEQLLTIYVEEKCYKVSKHDKSQPIDEYFHNDPVGANVYYQTYLAHITQALSNDPVNKDLLNKLYIDVSEGKLKVVSKMLELKSGIEPKQNTTMGVASFKSVRNALAATKNKNSLYNVVKSTKTHFNPDATLRNKVFKELLENNPYPEDAKCGVFYCNSKKKHINKYFPLNYKPVSGIFQYVKKPFTGQILNCVQFDMNAAYYSILKGPLPYAYLAKWNAKIDTQPAVVYVEATKAYGKNIAVMKVNTNGTYEWVDDNKLFDMEQEKVYNLNLKQKASNVQCTAKVKHYLIFRTRKIFQTTILEDILNEYDPKERKVLRNSIVGKLTKNTILASYVWFICGTIMRMRKDQIENDGGIVVRAHTDGMTVYYGNSYEFEEIVKNEGVNYLHESKTPYEELYNIEWKIEHVGEFIIYTPSLYAYRENGKNEVHYKGVPEQCIKKAGIEYLDGIEPHGFKAIQPNRIVTFTTTTKHYNFEKPKQTTLAKTSILIKEE